MVSYIKFVLVYNMVDFYFDKEGLNAGLILPLTILIEYGFFSVYASGLILG